MELDIASNSLGLGEERVRLGNRRSRVSDLARGNSNSVFFNGHVCLSSHYIQQLHGGTAEPQKL